MTFIFSLFCRIQSISWLIASSGFSIIVIFFCVWFAIRRGKKINFYAFLALTRATGCWLNKYWSTIEAEISLNTTRIWLYYAIKLVTPNNNFASENHLPKRFALHYNLNNSDLSTLISIYSHKSITKSRDFPMKILKQIFHIFLFIVFRWKKNGKCLTWLLCMEKRKFLFLSPRFCTCVSENCLPRKNCLCFWREEEKEHPTRFIVPCGMCTLCIMWVRRYYERK